MIKSERLLVCLLVPWACLAGPLTKSPTIEADPNDKCSYVRMDRCSQAVIVYSVNDTLPLDADEIDQACERQREDMQCIQDFYNSDCVGGIAKAVFKAAKEGIFDEVEGRCLRDSPRRKEYDEYVPCINKVGRKIGDCQRRMIQQLESIGAHTAKKERIPYGCCRFSEFLTCARDAIATECSPQHVEYGDSIVQSMSGNVLVTACSSYRHGEEGCNELRDLPLQSSDATTFTGPLIKVLGPLG